MTSSERGGSTWRGARTGRGGRRQRGRGRGGFFPGERSAARQALVDTANETKSVLPFVLKDLPNIKADESELLGLNMLGPLKKEDCPKHKKTTIKVINEDTFNAAIMLEDWVASLPALAPTNNSSTNQISPASSRPAVLNLASDTRPGGGWLTGAMAQEEALCYRSSLSLSLHKQYYPWDALDGVYTRDVVIIRSSRAHGHELLAPGVAAANLPIVSVLSIAAVRRPELADAQTAAGGKRKVFANANDRVLTKNKMRLALRMAATKGHDCLVLGALGCGAFKNPVEEIADAWKQVLNETEFDGGWWREVWFAVLDEADGVNFDVFEKVLAGMKV